MSSFEAQTKYVRFHNEKHNVSTTWRLRQQQYYSENNSSAFFLCVYIWAVLCKSSHTLTDMRGHVWMSCFRRAWLSLNFYKEYLFGFETLVFATSGILSMHKQLVALQRERKTWNRIWPLKKKKSYPKLEMAQYRYLIYATVCVYSQSTQSC